MWQDLLTALCLMLIVEGMLPFLYPNRWKDAVRRLSEMDSGSMRVLGLISMLAGAAGLYLVR
ncbi:MAG: DUF2065 domain-containing protein [Oleiphilus sp.]|nr:MAG: DUF2065 domain-containing protein [Oleiphilus sp.]